jgi:hypothetical protein
MPDNFTRLQIAPTLVRARHVGYSVRMVAEIAAHYDAALDASEFRTARCMLDAFYVHIRLLAEFLIRTTKGADFGPAEFGITWEAPEGAAATRLDEVWDIASKYVVHFGGRRVPKSVDELSQFTVDGPYFRQLASDALELYSVFVDEVANATPEWTKGAGALIPNPESDPEGWQARARADALRELRSARDAARRELAL